MRALTHRAVDQALALPDGSTSYYLRTRRALLERVVSRLAERTAADLRAARAMTCRPACRLEPDAHQTKALSADRRSARPT